MSLILEALKKLDREKQAPDRGLLVVGSASWPSNRGGRATAALSAMVGGALAVAAVAGVVWLFRNPRPPAAATPPASAALPVPARAPAPTRPMVPALTPTRAPAVATTTAPTRAATPAPGRATDPGVPAPVTAPKASPGADRFQLQAISAQDGHPVAILNDRLVREGDSFNGTRVLRIGTDEVEIEVAGRRRVVKF